jgi:hypothetical protein
MAIINETLLGLADDFDETPPPKKKRRRGKRKKNPILKDSSVVRANAAEARKNGSRSQLTVASQELLQTQQLQKVSATKKEAANKAYLSKKQNMDYLGKLTIEQWNDPNVQAVIRDKFPKASEDMNSLRDNSLKWKKASDHFSRQWKGQEIPKNDRVQAESIGMRPEDYQNPILPVAKNVFDIVKQSAIDAGTAHPGSQFGGIAAGAQREAAGEAALAKGQLESDKLGFQKKKQEETVQLAKDKLANDLKIANIKAGSKTDTNLAKFAPATFITTLMRDGLMSYEDARAEAKKMLTDKDFYNVSEERAEELTSEKNIYTHTDGKAYPIKTEGKTKIVVIGDFEYDLEALKKAASSSSSTVKKEPTPVKEQVKESSVKKEKDKKIVERLRREKREEKISNQPQVDPFLEALRKSR